MLENYIEGKSRHSFEDFQGLTSTPKKGVAFAEHSLSPTSPVTSKPSKSPLMGGRAILWDRAKRSSSSPLLSSPLKHPARLGHHDALIKSVSVTGYNGAAVPLLQSPLLRLARGQAVGSRGRKSQQQKAVSVSALPTAVSPLLVNLSGNRKSRFQGRDTPLILPDFHSTNTPKSTPSPLATRGPTKRSVYRKSASSDDCVAHYMRGSSVIHRRSVTHEPSCSFPSKPNQPSETSEGSGEEQKEESNLTNGKSFSSKPVLNGNTLNDSLLFKDLVTSTPKKLSDKPIQSLFIQEEINPPLSLVQPENPPSTLEVGQINAPPIRVSQLLSKDESFSKAVNGASHLSKPNIVNGDVLGIYDVSTLSENDLEASLDCFPWVSESKDDNF